MQTASYRLTLPNQESPHDLRSARQVAEALQQGGYVWSIHDVYNYCNPNRGKVRLCKRIVPGLTIERLSKD